MLAAAAVGHIGDGPAHGLRPRPRGTVAFKGLALQQALRLGRTHALGNPGAQQRIILRQLAQGIDGRLRQRHGLSRRDIQPHHVPHIARLLARALGIQRMSGRHIQKLALIQRIAVKSSLLALRSVGQRIQRIAIPLPQQDILSNRLLRAWQTLAAQHHQHQRHQNRYQGFAQLGFHSFASRN